MPPHTLQLTAKHPKTEHIEQDMKHILRRMRKKMGGDLVWFKSLGIGDHSFHQQLRTQFTRYYRPERKQIRKVILTVEYQLRQPHQHIDNNNVLYDRRKIVRTGKLKTHIMQI